MINNIITAANKCMNSSNPPIPPFSKGGLRGISSPPLKGDNEEFKLFTPLENPAACLPAVRQVRGQDWKVRDLLAGFTCRSNSMLRFLTFVRNDSHDTIFFEKEA